MIRQMKLWSIFAVACLATFWLLKPDPQALNKALVALPWQIERHADGSSSVFGLRLEHSSIAEALQSLGDDHDLAIIGDDVGNSSLEVYYSHFSAGPLKAKLIITAAANPDDLQHMRSGATSVSYTSSGARKYQLDAGDLQFALTLPVASLTLIPDANLNTEVIYERFGQPADTVYISDNESHYLYPDKGLDINLNREGKEVLQYVAPRSFAKLTRPLRSADRD